MHPHPSACPLRQHIPRCQVTHPLRQLTHRHLVQRCCQVLLPITRLHLVQLHCRVKLHLLLSACHHLPAMRPHRLRHRRMSFQHISWCGFLYINVGAKFPRGCKFSFGFCSMFTSKFIISKYSNDHRTLSLKARCSQCLFLGSGSMCFVSSLLMIRICDLNLQRTLLFIELFDLGSFQLRHRLRRAGNSVCYRLCMSCCASTAF